MEKTFVLVTGPGAGSSLSSRNDNDGRVPHRLGCGHEWPPCPRLWSGHHFMWHIYCLEMLVVFLALKHFLLDLGGHRVLGALTTQRWFLTSTTREVCIHAPFTGWCTKSLCGSSFRSLQALLGLLSLRRVFKASARQSSARTVSVSGGLYVSLLTGCLECGV